MMIFYYEILGYFFYVNHTQDYVTDVSCDNCEEYSYEKTYTYIIVNTFTNEANNVNFYSGKS